MLATSLVVSSLLTMLLRVVFSVLISPAAILAQVATPPAATPAPPVVESTATPSTPESTAPKKPEFQFQPSWETQKLAHTYLITIPAPRGQITDRNGAAMAQTRIANNLAISFPTPAKLSETDARIYILRQLGIAKRILVRDIPLDIERALKHYKNRAVLPLVIALDLNPTETELVQKGGGDGLVLQPVYQRFYPLGKTASHIIGYVGRQGRYSDGPIEPNELLWPQSDGREALELTFNEQLSGQPGLLRITIDNQGRKVSEKIVKHPVPGQNVITTLDLDKQRIVEGALLKPGRPCAMTLLDANTGEILAMASFPSYDPNVFIPQISTKDFELLSSDPLKPLIPRAFRASYPPGSTFKIITGLAAMNSGAVDPEDKFGGEASIQIGNKVFRNWKKSDVGPLNFVEAITQSCNTYFYKMGLKSGAQPIYEYADRLGFGKKTGIPINSEDDGNLTTTEYLLKTYNRRFMPGDVANLSIGQGDLLVTPLQLASAMAAVGNGGTVLQIRLVLQVQSVDNKILTGYDIRATDHIEIDKPVMSALREGLIGVVSSRSGTAGRAAAPNVQVAGKTGTAQWGAGKSEKVAAWFSGFAPAEKPKYAFAALFEGVPGDDDVHGGTNAAPIVGKVMAELFKDAPKEKKKARQSESENEETERERAYRKLREEEM